MPSRSQMGRSFFASPGGPQKKTSISSSGCHRQIWPSIASQSGAPTWVCVRSPVMMSLRPQACMTSRAISSPIADINNSPSYNLAGAITAALFLNRFVERAKAWMHLDIPAWIDRPKPGRRTGAEANTARALYFLLRKRYG